MRRGLCAGGLGVSDENQHHLGHSGSWSRTLNLGFLIPPCQYWCLKFLCLCLCFSLSWPICGDSQYALDCRASCPWWVSGIRGWITLAGGNGDCWASHVPPQTAEYWACKREFSLCFHSVEEGSWGQCLFEMVAISIRDNRVAMLFW